jgi:hypothetical protein
MRLLTALVSARHWTYSIGMGASSSGGRWWGVRDWVLCSPVACRRRPPRRIKDVRPELKFPSPCHSELKPTVWLRAQAPRAARSSTPAASHPRPPGSPHPQPSPKTPLTGGLHPRLPSSLPSRPPTRAPPKWLLTARPALTPGLIWRELWERGRDTATKAQAHVVAKRGKMSEG